MKRKRNLVKLLIWVPLISGPIASFKIQSLEKELAKERKPSFNQALSRLYSKVYFSDWQFPKTENNIKYWPTREEALNHPYRFDSNGDLCVVTSVGPYDNLYMILWESKNPTTPIKSTLSLIADGTLELNASLKSDSNSYVVIANYRGVNLYFAFECV